MDFSVSSFHKVMGSIRGIPRGKYRRLTPVRSVICSQCNKTYKRPQNLQQHMLSSHSNVRLQCQICSKKYTSRSVYNRHLKKVFLHFIHLSINTSIITFYIVMIVIINFRCMPFQVNWRKTLAR